MNEETNQTSLPSRETCINCLRLARFDGTVTCVHCNSEEIVKRGSTVKDAQQYWCKDCETYFNDLTDTIFGQHQLDVEEMFYIIKNINDEQSVQIARDLNRDYQAVLNFVDEIEQVRQNFDEFDLFELCESV